MESTVKIKITDSLYNIFEILKKDLQGKTGQITGRNLIICEEKVSLMAESIICKEFGATFNTDVYSFGNYVKKSNNVPKVLSKEGSSMAIRRILETVNLNLLSKNRESMSLSLYELIAQLKSAKVTVADLVNAEEKTTGLLKNKISDIKTVMEEYEKFLSENGFNDQSLLLNNLPKIIENDQSITDADVYVIGFTSFTAQIRSGIESLIKNAKSVTAILTSDSESLSNPFAFINETKDAFIKMCKNCGKEYEILNYPTAYSETAKELLYNVFNPVIDKERKINNNVYLTTYNTPYDEISKISSVIKKMVMDGKCRYKDVNIAIPNTETYAEIIKQAFYALEIPYFLDEKKKADCLPIVSLIISYLNVFNNKTDVESLISFVKNPLITEDKTEADVFENYVIKYKLNYEKLKKPLIFGDGESVKTVEKIKQKVLPLLSKFDVLEMLNGISAQDKLKEYSVFLKNSGFIEESEITSQIYEKVVGILTQMQLILKDTKISFSEYKRIFLSGIYALELSVLPQYMDAVFIGDYKEVALSDSKYLFMIGLTEDVPQTLNDVALLNDSDIEQLESIEVLIEPKIKIVNDRSKERLALCLSSFSDKLFLSRPKSSVEGEKCFDSEVLTCAKSLYKLEPLRFNAQYLTEKQGVNSFANACREFADKEELNFEMPSSFYSVSDKKKLDAVLKSANKQIKIRLENKKIEKKYFSPTLIESYFSCPYSAFLERIVGIKENEQGDITDVSIGTFIHAVFENYVKNFEQVKDEKSSKEVFNKAKETLLKDEKYSKYFQDHKTTYTLNNVISEAEKFCQKIYNQYKNSKFTPYKTELRFPNEAEKIGAIELDDGFKMHGIIDRIDVYKHKDENGKERTFYHVIDYKTGKVDSSISQLYAGVKLQLYLYASVIKDMELAGVYYMPVSDSYVKKEDKQGKLLLGKTLGDGEVIKAEDVNIGENATSELFTAGLNVDKNGNYKGTVTKEELKALNEYAIKMCNQAVKLMKDGVIVSSPYDGSCEYCKYKSLCGDFGGEERSKIVYKKEKDILSALEGEKNG